MAVDPAFGLNEFQKPKIYSESETLANNILATLFGKPGAYPTMPTFGMYIQGLIMKMDDDVDTEGIKSSLVQQCSAFNEVVRNGDFFVEKREVRDKDGKNRPMLIIGIPTQIKNESQYLVIGITRQRESLAYNFSYLKDQL